MRFALSFGVAAVVSLASPAHGIAVAEPVPGERVQLTVDSSESEAVLAILSTASTGAVEDSLWQRLFTSTPYVRLKKREAAMHRDFTDGDFRRFVLSPALAKLAPELERTLVEWKKADLRTAARRVLAYLPADATIRASVYLVIKPETNSFVFETATDPAIFLYLDPKVSSAKFENTVAHELHHIGYSSVAGQQEKALEKLPPATRTAVEWMGAFGEGFAMLAAAGGPDVHPHAVSDPDERARWDSDMANFNQDLKKLEKFFLDVVEGRLKAKEEIEKQAFSFFGKQGPWYTVGYRMALVIEKQDGRAVLIECMSDPRKLLSTYNRAAADLNAGKNAELARWSPELLARIGAEPGSSP